MMIVADTNILVRILMEDDPDQKKWAESTLDKASKVAIPNSVLIELSWVLLRIYKIPKAQVHTLFREIQQTEKFVLNHSAIDLGLQILEQGGDFSDGVIAGDGFDCGAEIFVSFDQRAIQLLRQNQFQALTPSEFCKLSAK